MLFSAIASGCQSSSDNNTQLEEVTTLILVRHAEKANDGTDDPPLTEKGETRAATLSDWLAFTDLAAIYSTSYKRNTMTVSPTASQKDLTITTYDAGQQPEDFLTSLLEQYKGETVLVCGHSNTIPPMLNRLLGQETYENLTDSDYNHIFIVTATALGNATVTDLQMDVPAVASP